MSTVKKKIMLTAALCITLIAIFFVVSKLLIPITSVTLSEMHWKEVNNFIAIKDVSREGQPTGILFINLRDGKEQFIAGQWEVNFGNSENMYVFGEFPDGFSKQTGQQMYLLEGKRNIYDIEMKNLPGRLVAVEENPLSTYLFLTMTTTTRTSFCILERAELHNPECLQLDIPAISKGKWHPKKDHELVIKTTNEAIYIYDPWGGKPKEISKKQSPDEYEKLTSFFTVKENNHTKEWQIIKYGTIVVSHFKNKRFISRVPLFSNIIQLPSEQHLLIKEKNKLSILKISDNKQTILLEEKNIGTKKIIWHDIDGDRTL